MAAERLAHGSHGAGAEGQGVQPAMDKRVPQFLL